MKKKIRRVLIPLVAIVFAVSCGMLLRQMIQYQQGDVVYDEAAQLAQLPDTSVPKTVQPSAVAEEKEEPYAAVLEGIDIAALKEKNDDVTGWILIPDTDLSYPLLQGEDNDYYLDHTWRKTKNAVGAIFVDYRNSADLSDFHTVIYGHRMNNDSMFGQLHKYQDAAYWEEHPKIYIADGNGSHTYEIFAAYIADSLDTYQMGFSSDAEKQDFLDYCISKSALDTGVVPTVADRVITLSTCTGNGHATRWVVQAVQRA